MPHFVIHCSENITKHQSADRILSAVHDTADATGLFHKGDIKVRIQTFSVYTVGNTQSDFIHVFGYIMQGRSTEQKAQLSQAVIAMLAAMFPAVPVVSMNVSDFEKATYFNRTMI